MTLTKITSYNLECNSCGNSILALENPRYKACANGWRNGKKILTSAKQSQSSIDICVECKDEGIYVNNRGEIIIPTEVEDE